MRTGSQPKLPSQFGISEQPRGKHDSETVQGARRHKFQSRMTPLKSVARPRTTFGQSSHKTATTAMPSQRNMNFNSKFKSTAQNEPMVMRSHHDLMKRSKASAERRPLPPTILGNDQNEEAEVAIVHQQQDGGGVYIQTQNASND